MWLPTYLADRRTLSGWTLSSTLHAWGFWYLPASGGPSRPSHLFQMKMMPRYSVMCKIALSCTDTVEDSPIHFGMWRSVQEMTRRHGVKTHYCHLPLAVPHPHPTASPFCTTITPKPPFPDFWEFLNIIKMKCAYKNTLNDIHFIIQHNIYKKWLMDKSIKNLLKVH